MYTLIVERTQIYLTRDQTEALDREARRTGRTRSHLIREAIDEKYGTASDSDQTGEEHIARLRRSRRLREVYGAEPDDTRPEQKRR
jgi:predicted DNA-binding protein